MRPHTTAANGPVKGEPVAGPERAGTIYRTGQTLARILWQLIGRLDVLGLDNIPATGPFLLISNHQSILDPILTQAVVRRPIYAMAKSTQFAAPVVGPIMPIIKTFPVRRYQVDAQAVRTALRLLHDGRGVAIYIEGERSWDGLLQEPKRGTVRLALRAGVPIIPVAVQGSYDAWPRWDRRPRPATVHIRFLPPILLPQLRGSENRKAVRETADRLMHTINDELLRLAAAGT